MERLARDETVDPSLYYFRTFMRFETSDPATAWLNRILCIGYGARENRAVKIAVHEVLRLSAYPGRSAAPPGGALQTRDPGFS
jgi:hypothetical protein